MTGPHLPEKGPSMPCSIIAIGLGGGKVSGFKFQVSGFRFCSTSVADLRFKFQVSGFKFQVSGFAPFRSQT